MPSLLDLPPEIRLIVYKFLLEDTETCKARLALVARRNKHGSHCLPAMTAPITHLTNLLSMASLASTCRKIHQETWPIIDECTGGTIYVTQGELLNIFSRPAVQEILSAKDTLLSSLHLSTQSWQPQSMEEIAQLISHHLPKLQKLSVSFCLDKSIGRQSTGFLGAVGVLTALPSGTRVKFLPCPDPYLTSIIKKAMGGDAKKAIGKIFRVYAILCDKHLLSCRQTSKNRKTIQAVNTQSKADDTCLLDTLTLRCTGIE